MTIQGVLTAAMDVAFAAVFIVTLRDYLTRRDRVSLAVVLVFGSLAIVLASSAIQSVDPAVAGVLGLVSLPAFLAQPVLVMWLVSQFRQVPRWILWAGIASFVGLMSSLVAATWIGTAKLPAWATTLILFGFVAYYVAYEIGAAIGFATEAPRRAGASRIRLATAGVATALIGVAIAILIFGGVATAGTSGSDGVAVAADITILLAALGYVVAFAPPRLLRRFSQQTIAYAFIRDLNALPDVGAVDQVWDLLRRTAVRASGAARADLVPDGVEASPEPRGRHSFEIPLRSDRGSFGRLRLVIAGSPLFVQDDMELITLLGDRAVRSVEREIFVQEREQLIADLSAASAAKSDFLAAMSHELRTPMNAIIGFSELLLETEDGATEAAVVRSYAEHIHGSGLHLLDLINEVLDLAKVEAGRLELNVVPFDLGELLGQIAATMRPLAERKAITITAALPKSGSVLGDPARIRQIAFNLVSNAIKFTAHGGSVRITGEVDGDDVRISVADDGAGIAPADLHRIFEAFEQVGDQSGTEGTGLGLALSRRLAEAHGGRIEVESALGKGSRFLVRLPRRPTSGASLPSPLPSPLTPALPAPRPAIPTVLVIEDDPAAADLLRVHLESVGFAVTTTADGSQGLAWARELRPDAIVLDILLPDIDGWEVLQRLKQSPATRAIPVLVASVVDDRPLGLALGAVDYFVKPISREPLLEALGRLTFTTKVRSRTVTALVIDPEPAAVARYRSVLEPEGFRVIWAADRAAGEDEARAKRPDLILVDVLLEGGAAFDLIASLKHDPGTSEIPIWVTTPESLAPEERARLHGDVMGIVERGDGALDALRGWLRPTASPPAAGTVPAGSAAPAPTAPPTTAVSGSRA
jgi:signal transduction histidine kinase/DNA-binding response OmpR family regulator